MAVPTIRLFANAREAAGTDRDVIDADTVGAVLDVARQRYGPTFTELLETCKVWLNGEEADLDARVGADDEVAILPPVSGGT